MSALQHLQQRLRSGAEASSSGPAPRPLRAGLGPQQRRRRAPPHPAASSPAERDPFYPQSGAEQLQREAAAARRAAASPPLSPPPPTLAAPASQRRAPPRAAGAPDADVLIEFRDVHKSFGSKKILRGASFKIRRGEAVGIIGSSGTGKSTALRLAAGLLEPDQVSQTAAAASRNCDVGRLRSFLSWNFSIQRAARPRPGWGAAHTRRPHAPSPPVAPPQGEIWIKGEPRRGLLSDDDTSGKLKVGLVFQSGALFDSLTVRENVGFTLYEHTSLPAARVEAAVADSLAKVRREREKKKKAAGEAGGADIRAASTCVCVRWAPRLLLEPETLDP
jgi:ABC-type transporter Mla maintaining outer membrane lipid asymmetry ATPase subunit MlaF